MAFTIYAGFLLFSIGIGMYELITFFILNPMWIVSIAGFLLITAIIAVVSLTLKTFGK